MFILYVTGIVILAFFLLLLLIPFSFTFYSLVTVYSIPAQLVKLAKNPLMRKNHAIEHATINVLAEKFQYKKLAGFSGEEGFFIFGCNDIEAVRAASLEGLSRLKKGESKIAIHKECGTSAGVANFVMALVFLILLFTMGFFSFIFLFLALIISMMTGPYLGELAQVFLTTSSDVRDMEIKNLEYRVFKFLGTSRVMESQIFVVTNVTA